MGEEKSRRKLDPSALAEVQRHELNLETGRIAWVELQRHFASGRLVAVDATLDLVEVAQRFAADDKTVVERWLAEATVHPVTDDEARDWLAREAWLWAVVTKPWVLVQARADDMAD
ncbi:MAG: DUF2288 domain-containing protein [Gammaproteobacteria bacterium]|jgi:hypothetical protein